MEYLAAALTIIFLCAILAIAEAELDQ